MGNLTYILKFIAPEVMCRQPHTFAVDYFALGVLAYEFMLGRVDFFKFIFNSVLILVIAEKRYEIKF